jgi:heavy metal efflux system protein
MLMTAIGMNELGVSGNLMSLGALDFGLIVDGAVIIVENCLRRLAERQHHEGRLLSLQERLFEVTEASQGDDPADCVRSGDHFPRLRAAARVHRRRGQIVFADGDHVMLALAGAFILSLTFVPAMVAILIRGKVAEKEVARSSASRRRVMCPSCGPPCARRYP